LPQSASLTDSKLSRTGFPHVIRAGQPLLRAVIQAGDPLEAEEDAQPEHHLLDRRGRVVEPLILVMVVQEANEVPPCLTMRTELPLLGLFPGDEHIGDRLYGGPCLGHWWYSVEEREI